MQVIEDVLPGPGHRTETTFQGSGKPAFLFATLLTVEAKPPASIQAVPVAIPQHRVVTLWSSREPQPWRVHNRAIGPRGKAGTGEQQYAQEQGENGTLNRHADVLLLP